MRSGTSRWGDSPRAQSEVVGVVLVLGMVLAGATTVVVFGASAFADSQEGLATQRAEKAMTQFDSKAALVALGNTDVQRVSFAQRSGEQYGVTNGTGWMNVSVQNTTDGTWENTSQRLGSVTYDNGDDHIAYQGGGVWRSTGPGSVMVSPPEFHYRNGTLTLPIINVTGAASLNGGAGVTHAETIQAFPDRTAGDRQNPMDEHRMWVEVQGDYYEAWGRYFSDRTDGTVAYDHSRNTATLELVSPIGRQRITSAASSQSASGAFEIHGKAHVDCGDRVYTNSYDSRRPVDYCAQESNGDTGSDGDLVYGKDVDIDAGSGSSDIRGDVSSGGTVTVSGSSGSGQPTVVGDIEYTDACDPSVSDCEDRSSGTVREIAGINTMNSIDIMVENTVDMLAGPGNNDNAGVAIDGSDRLDFSATSPADEVTLGAGEYYLEDVVLQDDETLVLDTTGGPVTVGVRGGIQLQGSGSSGGTIQVVGDGAVEMYVLGDDGVHGRSDDLAMQKNTGILESQDNATKFRLYGPRDLEAQIGGGSSTLATYVGVIFTPPGPTGTARVDIDGGEVYGGVLTGTTTIDKGSIHYDEALATTQVVSRDARVVKVTFLHVTVNRVLVSDR